MAMTELKQKILLHELAKLGFPDAVYISESDKIKVQPDNDRLPFISDAGGINYGAEHEQFVRNTLRPIVNGVNESVAAWEKARAVPFEDLKQFRILVAHNNVLLAARDDTELGRGLHFVTWRYDHDLTGVEHGFYTEDYMAAKENFATRSELVSENKLLTEEKAAELVSAVEYRLEHDDSLTYVTEEELKSIAAQLRYAYPATESQEAEKYNDVFIAEPIEAIEDGEATDSNDGHDTEDISDLHSRLVERIDKNLSDYHLQLESYGNLELIGMAGKIAATADAHSYLTAYHDFDEYELEYLLEFQNPLEVLADEWLDRNIDLGDMSFAMEHIYQNSDLLLEQYPVIHGLEAVADTSLRRYMDVDLELYLGGIADKVVIHEEWAWVESVETLKYFAHSGSAEDKRLFWQVSESGINHSNERDSFITDTLSHKLITEYKPDAPDTLCLYVEVTGIGNNGAVKGNVFEVGDYDKFAQHIRDTAIPLESTTHLHSRESGTNPDKTVNVSHPQDKLRLAAVVSNERSKRMALPVGDTSELIQKADNKFTEIRKLPVIEEKAAEKPKPKTLAEKMQVAGEKVKAQDEQPKNPKARKRDERA